MSDLNWIELNPQSPQFFFVPKDFSVQEEYENGFKIDELMNIYKTGIESGKDDLFISQSYNEEKSKIKEVLDNNNLLQEKYRIKTTSSFRIGNHVSGKSFD